MGYHMQLHPNIASPSRWLSRPVYACTSRQSPNSMHHDVACSNLQCIHSCNSRLWPYVAVKKPRTHRFLAQLPHFTIAHVKQCFLGYPVNKCLCHVHLLLGGCKSLRLKPCTPPLVTPGFLQTIFAPLSSCPWLQCHGATPMPYTKRMACLVLSCRTEPDDI